MHAEVFTVAVAGEVVDGLLSMTRGGWESCEIAQFPAQVDLVLAGVIVYAPENCGRHHVISVSIEGSDGRVGGFGDIQVAPSAAAPVVKTPFVFPLTLTLAGPVVLSLSATVEGGPTFGPTQFEVRPRFGSTGDLEANGTAEGDDLLWLA
jgi:hypothetical protein